MSEKIEKLTNRYAALENPSIRVSSVEEGRIYHTMIKLSDDSEWLLDDHEAELLEGMVRLEASKTGLVTERDNLEQFEQIIRLARDRCRQMNWVH